MLPQRNPKHVKPAGRLISERKSRIKVAVVPWVTAAFVVLMAIGASARNGLHESAIKIASDKMEREMLVRENPAPTVSSGSKIGLKQTKIPEVAVPHGIDSGNKFIAQGSGSGSSSGGGAVYDPLRRIVKIVETRGGTVTSTKQFVWAGDQLAEERDASGNVTRRFFDLGEQIAGTNYYFTRDQNDSVREMTDSTGAVQSEFNYDPYGRPTQVAGTGATPDFGYAGMYIHQPSGLNLAVNRAYSPSQGRFISRDPIDDPMFGVTPRGPEPADPGAAMMVSGFGQAQAMSPQDSNQMTIQMVSNNPLVQSQIVSAMGQMSPQRGGRGKPRTNPYTYVANNPINHRDPSGLDADWAWCSAYCTLHAKGALAWIICMEECLRGFPPHCQPSH